MDISAYLKEEKERIDSLLSGIIAAGEFCTAPAGAENTLQQAMAYSLTAGGKRLRPILALSAYEACSGFPPGEEVYRGACALELIHTYTLIHDDLPEMDNDDFRRGLPTCHRKFGVRTAMFAGLGLLFAAFELLGRTAQKLALPAGETGKIFSAIAAAVGGGGVIGGQVVDLESERKMVSDETLLYIHSHKTGALIRVSCQMGGWLARAGEASLSALGSYGERIGLAFQIVDDILDIEGDSSELGKGVGADRAMGKTTFPSRFGVVESRKLACAAVGEAKEVLRETRFSGDSVLVSLADFIISRSS